MPRPCPPLPMSIGVLGLLLAWLPVGAPAQGFEPVDAIRAAALATLPPGTEAEATLDPALRLPACGAPLRARREGAATVEVTCSAEAGWRLFVPVRVRRSQTVLVLRRGLGAGESVSEDMLVAETRDASRIVGAALAEPQGALGRIARRALPAGSVLMAGDLTSPRLIRRGDSVALVARRGGVEVRMAGRALGDAGENERVNVENLASRRTVQGVVGAGGEVQVGL